MCGWLFLNLPKLEIKLSSLQYAVAKTQVVMPGRLVGFRQPRLSICGLATGCAVDAKAAIGYWHLLAIQQIEKQVARLKMLNP